MQFRLQRTGSLSTETREHEDETTSCQMRLAPIRRTAAFRERFTKCMSNDDEVFVLVDEGFVFAVGPYLSLTLAQVERRASSC